jgi:hypothetical protein
MVVCYRVAERRLLNSHLWMTLLIAPYHLEVVEEREQFHRKSYSDVLPSD